MKTKLATVYLYFWTICNSRAILALIRSFCVGRVFRVGTYFFFNEKEKNEVEVLRELRESKVASLQSIKSCWPVDVSCLPSGQRLQLPSPESLSSGLP